MLPTERGNAGEQLVGYVNAAVAEALDGPVEVHGASPAFAAITLVCNDVNRS